MFIFRVGKCHIDMHGVNSTFEFILFEDALPIMLTVPTPLQRIPGISRSRNTKCPGAVSIFPEKDLITWTPSTRPDLTRQFLEKVEWWDFSDAWGLRIPSCVHNRRRTDRNGYIVWTDLLNLRFLFHRIPLSVDFRPGNSEVRCARRE